MRAITRALRSAPGAPSVMCRATASMAASIRSLSSGHMVIAALVQVLPDDSPCFGHAPFDRAYRGVQHDADLLVGMLAGLGQQQRVAQLRSEREDRPSDGALELIVHGGILRCRMRSGDSVERRLSTFVVGCRDYPPPDACQAAATIDGLVPGDGQEPCLEARGASKTVEAAVRGEKCLLCSIFRVCMRAQRRPRRPVDRRTMPIDQLAKRGRIALPRPLHEDGVVHTYCSHVNRMGACACSAG